MIKAWHEHDDIEFNFVNSHDKASAVRDTSISETLRRSLLDRLRNSKNFLLVVGPTTKYDTDWVPFEISQAVDAYELPIIAVYTGYDTVFQPDALSDLWPAVLRSRIQSKSAKVLHIPFKRVLIDKTIREYDINNPPQAALTYFTPQTYRSLGLIK